MKNLLMGSGPVMAMLLLQGLGTALQLLTKVALNKGTFVYAFVVYRHAIATLCVAPFAFFFERYILHHGLFPNPIFLFFIFGHGYSHHQNR